ncbi:unnamed protein product, partial [Symbiodinium sp. KB8]
MSQHSNVGRVPYDLPQILPRDGTWSDASSVPGRRAGNHYEAFVRQRLTGCHKKQDGARFSADLDNGQCQVLNGLWTQAMTISEESTRQLWEHLKPEEQKAVAGPHSAEADIIITEAKMNVIELLGSKAEVLLGPESMPAGTIVEVTVNAALFYIKCHQLERLLMLAEKSSGNAPPAAALVVNKKPIKCAGQWSRAIEMFPTLSRLHNDAHFSLVYCPHGLNYEEYEDMRSSKDAEISSKDAEISSKDA